MTAVITQVVPVIQPPAIRKFQGIWSLYPIRCEEVVSRVSIIVATQPPHLVLEARGQAHCQLAIPVIGDHQPKVQLDHALCSTLVHKQLTITQGGGEAGALIVNLQRDGRGQTLV